MADTDATSGLSYRNAMEELQSIVQRLRESEDVDVDELVKDVARAKELIDFCNGKIKRAEAEIKTIVDELQTGDGRTSGEAAPPTRAARAD